MIIVRQSLHGMNLSQKSPILTEYADVVHTLMYGNMLLCEKRQKIKLQLSASNYEKPRNIPGYTSMHDNT